MVRCLCVPFARGGSMQQGTNLPNILQFIITLSQVYRKVDLR